MYLSYIHSCIHASRATPAEVWAGLKGRPRIDSSWPERPGRADLENRCSGRMHNLFTSFDPIQMFGRVQPRADRRAPCVSGSTGRECAHTLNTALRHARDTAMRAGFLEFSKQTLGATFPTRERLVRHIIIRAICPSAVWSGAQTAEGQMA